jgi:hypothetical protein
MGGRWLICLLQWIPAMRLVVLHVHRNLLLLQSRK